MTTTLEYRELYDRIAALRQTMVDRLDTELIQNPHLAEAIAQEIDEILVAVDAAKRSEPIPPDYGLAELVGVGDEAATELGETRIPPPVPTYDETVTSERLLAVGDLYYLYQHEKIGVFAALLKLQQLFKAGTVRLSSGEGAFGLYQFDRRQVLRHTRQDRLQAYRRVFGYTSTAPPAGAKPNREFHRLFVHFVDEVTQFFRDKRISEVIRPRVADPTFGSVAVVRRAGLDLRNNLKVASYGHINVLRVEMLQLLEEAFVVLGSPDIKKLFGADHAWDVIEEIHRQFLNRPQISASQRHRMATAGREIVRWLAQPYILNATRSEFEALLTLIADEVEEWHTSAEVLNIAPVRKKRPAASSNGKAASSREMEWTY